MRIKLTRAKKGKKDDDSYVGQVASSENFLIVYNHDVISITRIRGGLLMMLLPLMSHLERTSRYLTWVVNLGL